MITVAVNKLVDSLKPRQKEVIIKRYALKGGPRETLASLGEKNGITRERVRQIEAEALDNLREYATKEKVGKEASDSIASHLKNMGGLRRDNILLDELKNLLGDKNLTHWHLRFFSEIIGQPFYYAQDDDFYHFWYLNEDHIKKARDFISKLEKLIKTKKADIVDNGNFHVYLTRQSTEHKIPHFVGSNYISVSKRFHVNQFGDFGLSDWEEINPKTMRSHAYLVLKKEGKPMHFKEVTDAINKINADLKALPQTIHNELIKDPRIVLVGRGLYSLPSKEYVNGTCREVIAKILKKNGPLSSEKILMEVSKQRILKNNTILFNLQNKNYFKRLGDGRYMIVK